MSSDDEPISSEEAFKPQDIKDVLSLAHEPSYVSEIARKMRVISDRWANMAEKTTIGSVAKLIYALEEEGRVETTDVGYENNEGQAEGSPHLTFSGQGGEEETTEWKQYTLVHDPDIEFNEARDEVKAITDTSVSVPAKVDIINTLSGKGNIISQQAETILQDTMRRQFRYYDVIETPDYNDPGVDFYVEDSEQRDYGLAIEVSTRYVNPIGKPYLNAKKEKADELDADLVIIAPKFTDELLMEYENPDNPRWHSDDGSELIHLHEVPSDSPIVYRPFAKKPYDDNIKDAKGNPIIIPDNERVQSRLIDRGRVGEEYPVVNSDYSDFVDAITNVNRDAFRITESAFRNQIREAIEPVLGNLMKPYKVEQFLVDMYWDKSLTQSEIGRLVGRSGGTIGDWMASDKWNIITRGTGAPELDNETVEIWKRMYNGEPPFVDENGDSIEHSGYRIQAEYNRHPLWTLDDWEEWYQDTTEEERMEMMTQSDSFRNGIDYTIMLGPENRLQPSYSFILRTLKDNGVEVRAPDEAPRVPYPAYANRETLRYMLNRSSGTFEIDNEGEQMVTQADVEIFDSYLEVDVATWLSENEIPYAHEPFTIPSLYGANRDRWDDMVKTVRQVGRGEDVGFEDFSGFEIFNMWSEIYDKHRLQEEQVTIPIRDSLALFAKNFVLPDLVLYPEADSSPKDADWDGWDSWDAIIEVSGLYGVGIPEDAGDDEWFRWYRVAGVAFKELAYKLLDLWEDVYFLVPNEPYIEGVSSGLPQPIRNDDHYIVFNTTSSEVDLTELGVRIGAGNNVVETGLSPAIRPTSYDRPAQGVEDIDVVEYTFDSLDLTNIDDVPNAFIVGDEWIVYDGYMSDVYVTDGTVHLRESQWRDENLVLMREYVLDVLSDLSEFGIVRGLRQL